MPSTSGFSKERGILAAAPVPGVKLSRKSVFYVISSVLISFWVLLALSIRDTKFAGANVPIAAVMFGVIGLLAIHTALRSSSRSIRHYMFLWFVAKIIFGLVYFETLYIQRTGDSLGVFEYGDSFLYHKVALDYNALWQGGDLFVNPFEVSSQLEQWGYGYFLAVLYYVAGPLPGVGIVVNGFLALVFCLLGHRMLRNAGFSEERSGFGLVLLSMIPILWLVSSTLIKDPLLFVLVLACSNVILELVAQDKKYLLPYLFMLILALMLFRYSYVFVMLFMLVVTILYLREVRLGKVLVVGFSLFAFILLVDNLQLLKFGGISDIGLYIRKAMSMETRGGGFMTQGLGSSISLSNFYYTLPAKALYILLIPFPWFDGRFAAEKLEYVFNHLDTVMYLALIAAVVFSLVSRTERHSKEQKLLLLVGTAFFSIPLFMFFPGRRYVSVCIPFFLAYSLPYISKKPQLYRCLSVSLGIILAMQFMYYVAY